MDYTEFGDEIARSFDGINLDDVNQYKELMDKHDDMFDEYTNDSGNKLPSKIGEGMFYKKPVLPTQLANTPFFTGALNLVAGRAKSGKTYSTLQALYEAGIYKDPTKRVIWLDKDYNVSIPLYEGLECFNSDVDEAFELLCKADLTNIIVVVDSLKDFVGNLDSNEQSQEAMEHIRRLVKKNATVILIAHTTLQRDNGKVIGEKLQGNEQTIKSKCDAVFNFADAESKKGIKAKSFTMLENRLGIESGTKTYIYDRGSAIEVIKNTITAGMTRRELTKSFTSALTHLVLSLEGIAFKTIQDGKKTIVEAL